MVKIGECVKIADKPYIASQFECQEINLDFLGGYRKNWMRLLCKTNLVR